MKMTDPYSTVRGSKAGEFFEPYARLIQVLYARAKGIAFYDAAGELLWQRGAELDAALGGAVLSMVQDASDPEKAETAGSQRMLQGSTPVYLFWLRADRGAPLGIAAVTGKPPGMNAPPATLPEIQKALQPALQCLSREVAALRRLPSVEQEQLARDLEQSEWIAARLLPLVNDGVQREPLRAMLRALVDHTDGAIAALVLPDRALRLVVEPDGWNNEQAQEALRRAHRRVLGHVQKKRGPLVSNRIREADGEAGAYRLAAVPIGQGHDQVAGYCIILKSSIGSDFGALEQRLLERVAPLLRALVDRDYDSLTALRNSASFEQAALRMLPPDATPPSSLIVVDIAQLGQINERCGADAGDRVIRRVAKLLRAPQLPEGTLCTRLSGGRFACLLLRRDVDETEQVAGRVREAARRLAAAGNSKVMEVRLRTGIAAIGRGVSGLRDALIAAHSAAHDPEQNAASAAPHDRSGSGRHRSGKAMVPMFLREALREDRLRVFAQPMHALRDPRRPVRLELLARILDEKDRLVAPMEFLAAGTDPDAMAELDRGVMTLAMEALAEHSSMLARRRLELALNVSGRSLEITEFHDWICQQLRRGIVPADAWLFEISESIASRQQRDVERFARRVMGVGARVVLDDVGSAGTDAVRLRTHGASAIKMDGSLIRDLADDPRAQRLVEALTQWAGASRMETVAEQVESELVRDQLARFGIDYVQGFLIGEPRPLVVVLDELANDPAFHGKRAVNG